MVNANRVQSRLLRVFLLQLALISGVTFAGVLAASWVAERILLNQALSAEADFFWNQRKSDPLSPVPGSLNLQGFLDGDKLRNTPPELSSLALGQQRVNYHGDDVLAYVSDQGGKRLTLLFQDETVAKLGFYFGVVPLSLVLLLVYSMAFMAYVLSKRAVSPIAKLSEIIEKFDFNSRDASELDLGNFTASHNSETLVLADALQHFVARTGESLERERNFARYASHELRTPVAVIQGSISTLELLDLEGAPQRAVKRIGRASKDMADLITTLMHLARNNIEDTEQTTTDINSLVKALASEINEVLPQKAVEIRLHHSNELFVDSGSATVRIVIGNLMRNAYLYTEQGFVDVTVTSNSVIVADSGPGLSIDAQRRIFEPFYRRDENTTGGAGLGLAIVKTTCENFGWELDLESTPGRGSRFTITFAQDD